MNGVSARVPTWRSADLASPAAAAGITLLRLLTGAVVLVVHGWHKVVDGLAYLTAGADWPLLHDTTALGFPAPAVFASLAALTQFAGGGLLAVGAFTRPTALAISGTMAVAVLFNLQQAGPDVQLAALYTLVATSFVLIGGGPWSVDAWLGRRR
jgi:putative oxidoreductase